MRVIVTRPAAQAASWVASLSAKGLHAVALPLIEIGSPADDAPVRAAWESLALRRLVVFVSPNAAAQFFARRPEDRAWPDRTQAASVGPGTSDALRQHGVPSEAIVEPAADARQFDSEALWAQLEAQDWNGRSVLVVRGDGGREWLADTLRSRGAQVDHVTAYCRRAPHFDADARQLVDAALSEPARHLWFFSSSEAIDHLAQAWSQTSWSRSCALATHPRIARRATDCGFGAVHECRPTLDAVVACIQSIAP